jgi:hypothetical protein
MTNWAINFFFEFLPGLVSDIILFVFFYKEWVKRNVTVYDFSNCRGGVNDTCKHTSKLGGVNAESNCNVSFAGVRAVVVSRTDNIL